MTFFRSIFLMAAVALVSVVWPAAPVSAHVLQVDGEIGVTVHIDPDDDPVANQQLGINLTIQDKSNRFAQVADCTCTLTVRSGEQTLQTIPLNFTGSKALVSYTFPQNGTYNLTVKGDPKTANAFQPFAVNFQYYVRSGTSGIGTKQPTNPLRASVPFAVIGAGLAILMIWFWPFTKQAPKSSASVPKPKTTRKKTVKSREK